MTEHTPGPWHVRYLTNVFADRRTVANCGSYSTNGPDEEAVSAENRANAALIAAAPDLLASLEALWSACVSADEDLPAQIDGSLLDAASAALAKARP